MKCLVLFAFVLSFNGFCDCQSFVFPGEFFPVNQPNFQLNNQQRNEPNNRFQQQRNYQGQATQFPNPQSNQQYPCQPYNSFYLCQTNYNQQANDRYVQNNRAAYETTTLSPSIVAQKRISESSKNILFSSPLIQHVTKNIF
jgi:hypothetical protein